jgi:hypothetical protein
MGALRTPVPQTPAQTDDGAGAALQDEVALELMEVPAAVVCASCGSPECPGCEHERPSHFSGVVAIVPWERPGAPLAVRLWSTAKLGTLSPDDFFATLPPGSPARALSFALIAELLAALGLCATVGFAALLVLPALGAEVWYDRALQGVLLRTTAIAVPGLALVMVLLHAAHGLALDDGARKAGSRYAGRGLRFGLYGCGWDLLTLPLGLLLLSMTDGARAAFRAAPRGLTAPQRAAISYLQHVHQLDRAAAQRAARAAVLSVAVPLFVVVALAFVIGLLVAAR